MDKLRLMVVDDHDVVRMGLKALIESQEDLEFIAEASGGQEAVTKATTSNPDIIIMDVRMPEGGGRRTGPLRHLCLKKPGLPFPNSPSPSNHCRSDSLRITA